MNNGVHKYGGKNSLQCGLSTRARIHKNELKEEEILIMTLPDKGSVAEDEKKSIIKINA